MEKWDNRAHNTGRLFANIASMFTGAAEFLFGKGLVVGGVAAAPETAGFSLAASYIGYGVAAHGTIVVANGATNLLQMVSASDESHSGGSGSEGDDAGGGLLEPGSGNAADDAAKGVAAPDEWITKESNKGGGTVFKDPSNDHNSIRVMPGKPNSPNILHQKPYVKFMKEGKFYDENGKVLPDGTVPEAHIPLDRFDINKMPNF